MENLDEQIKSLCEGAIERRTFPGCTVAYARGGRRQVAAYGRLTYLKDAPVVRPDTLYDVASITKSIPTSSIILKLIEDGRLSLDDNVAKYIPEMQNSDRAGLLVRHLLTYTMVPDIPEGLAAIAGRTPERLLPTILNAPLKAPPGRLYHYTNSPAILLGLIAEKVVRRPLDAIASEWFFEPLGMTDSTFKPGPDSGAIAPTEITEPGKPPGEVHDETAWALQRQGIIAGCAGLFSTASDILRFCEMVLAGGTWDGRTYFQPETIEQMRTNQLDDIAGTAGLGWEINRPEIMGKAQRGGGLMKSGFTGCWVAIDPAQSLALVHLSNRTYPHRTPREPIQAFWRQLNEAVFLV